MLRQGKLIPPFGNTELLTKNVWLLCIDIQMLNEKLNDIKELVNGDYGYRRYMEKDVKHYQPLIDEKEEEMLSVKDLIKQKNFIGSQDAGQPLPVVGIVDKMNGQGDFFFQQSSDLIFTNTTKRVITSIATSIHDPDGRLSRVDQNSAVLYRINKHVNADLTPLQTLMMNKDKQSKETIKNLNEDLSL